MISERRYRWIRPMPDWPHTLCRAVLKCGLGPFTSPAKADRRWGFSDQEMKDETGPRK